LFVCLTRCGMWPRVGDKHGRDLSVTVGTTNVPLVLDSMAAAKQIERERHGYVVAARGPKDKMRLSIAHRWSGEKLGHSWEDEQGKPLERRLREIAAAIIVFAEQSVRDGALHAHEWRIKRKAELEEAERKRKAEQERRRLERIAKAEKARVDLLLAQAAALHRAQQIRAYVESVRTLNATSPEPMTPEDLASWSDWALAQADRIDPVISGAFKNRPAEPDE
jgi:leucyl aminopeptidase